MGNNNLFHRNTYLVNSKEEKDQLRKNLQLHLFGEEADETGEETENDTSTENNDNEEDDDLDVSSMSESEKVDLIKEIFDSEDEKETLSKMIAKVRKLCDKYESENEDESDNDDSEEEEDEED